MRHPLPLVSDATPIAPRTVSFQVAMVRPFLRDTIGLEGTMADGPWSYRIGSLLLISPIYACVRIVKVTTTLTYP